MAGFLTRIFDQDEAQAGQDGSGPDDGHGGGAMIADEAAQPAFDAGAPGETGGGEGGGVASNDSVATDAGLDLGIDPTIALHSEMGGSYYNLDGSETTWSRTDDLAVTLDLDATAHLITGITQDFTAEG